MEFGRICRINRINRINRISGGGLWTPANLSVAPLTWYEPRLVAPVADGTNILPLDLTANGNHQTQGTAALRPTYQSGVINGKPVYRFNGTTQRTTVTYGAAMSQPFTRIVLLSSTRSGGVPGQYLDSGSGGSRAAFYWNRASGDALQFSS